MKKIQTQGVHHITLVGADRSPKNPYPQSETS